MDFYSLFLNIIPLVLSASTEGKKEIYPSGDNTDQAAALQFLQAYNDQILKLQNKAAVARWNYNYNLTGADENTTDQANKVLGEFEEEAWKNATSFAWKDFKDTNKTAYRMFKKLSYLGGESLSKEKLQERGQLASEMDYISSTSQVCVSGAFEEAKCGILLEPELTEFCIRSRDYKETSYYWCEWHNDSGKIMKDKFIRYVELSNEAAELYGFNDKGEMWREAYESEDFEEDVEEQWKTLKPLYDQLHAYVRQKLRKQNPYSGIKPDGPIPAHLLGNFWGQDWDEILEFASPYPGKEYPDVSKIMEEKNITSLDVVKMSEEFYTSIGLMEMTPEFWHRSVFDCNAPLGEPAFAKDFHDGKDCRIYMCSDGSMEDFKTVHHEMGHVEYFFQYAKQPALFQGPANPGFHEAVGDAILLSASTPEHLKAVGLLEEVIDDKEADINTLFRTALEEIVLLPFAYLLDTWRWKVFDGSISEEELNQKWWEMRLKYQGVCPPVRKTNEDLDPAFQYFVANDIPYIRYFVGVIVEFQFHKAMCDEAGHQGPLHKCNIYNSKKAGKLLSDMLSKGSSEHWEEAMSVITNGKSRKMDATAFIEYFTPLIDWLKEQNKNETVGWRSSDPMICP